MLFFKKLLHLDAYAFCFDAPVKFVTQDGYLKKSADRLLCLSVWLFFPDYL